VEFLNLRGHDMSVKRRRLGRELRPETLTTSAKWTGVRDPRATVRFSLDERVIWDQGHGSVILATIVAFVDECTVQVRLENGRTVLWPTFSPRMRRVQTPDFDEMSGDGNETMDGMDLPALHRPTEESYYEAVLVTAPVDQRRTLTDFTEYGSTCPGAHDDDKTRDDG
jgi:hypothetical protein